MTSRFLLWKKPIFSSCATGAVWRSGWNMHFSHLMAWRLPGRWVEPFVAGGANSFTFFCFFFQPFSLGKTTPCDQYFWARLKITNCVAFRLILGPVDLRRNHNLSLKFMKFTSTPKTKKDAMMQSLKSYEIEDHAEPLQKEGKKPFSLEKKSLKSASNISSLSLSYDLQLRRGHYLCEWQHGHVVGCSDWEVGG